MTLSMAVGDLQQGMKRSRLESPGVCFFLVVDSHFHYTIVKVDG